MNERQQLKQAIAAQESLRGRLENEIIDAAITTLKEKLAALDSHPQQQRKLATILFADIVGSTQLTQGMDPEEQMALIDPLVQRLAARVSQHGGHVCRFQGDGFKAVFGLPPFFDRFVIFGLFALFQLSAVDYLFDQRPYLIVKMVQVFLEFMQEIDIRRFGPFNPCPWAFR